MRQQQAHGGQLPPQRVNGLGRQERHPVLVALAAADGEAVVLKINVLDAQFHGLGYAQTRAVEQPADQEVHAAEMIEEDIRARLLRLPGIAQVEIEVVWEPVWTKARLTEEGRDALLMVGVSV